MAITKTPRERFFPAKGENTAAAQPPSPRASRRAGRRVSIVALWGALAGATFGLGAAACAGKPAQTTSAAATATAEADDAPIVSGLNATVIVSKCPDAAHMKVRSAQATIQKLVGPCASVPGGRAHFSATLEPGGAIVLASPEGDPAEGVVPTCVLQNKLVHKLSLKKACTLDVQLDERKVPVAGAGTGTDAH